MRTTLNLEDDLIRQVKRRAVDTGQTMTGLIEEAMRQMLASEPWRDGGSRELRWVTVEGRVLEGVDLVQTGHIGNPSVA